MANFAVAGDAALIDQGKELLKKLQGEGESQADALRKIFQIASENMDNMTLSNANVDVQALDAAMINIKSMFLAAVGGKEEIILASKKELADLTAEKNQIISDLQQEKADMVAEFDKKVSDLEQVADKNEQIALQASVEAARAKKSEEAAQEQTTTLRALCEEKEKTIVSMTEKMTTSDKKVSEYDQLNEEFNVYKKEKEKEISDLRNSFEKIKDSMERKFSEMKKDAEIEKLKAVQALEKENAKLQAKVELLQQRPIEK